MSRVFDEQQMAGALAPKLIRAKALLRAARVVGQRIGQQPQAPPCENVEALLALVEVADDHMFDTLRTVDKLA